MNKQPLDRLFLEVNVFDAEILGFEK